MDNFLTERKNVKLNEVKCVSRSSKKVKREFAEELLEEAMLQKVATLRWRIGRKLLEIAYNSSAIVNYM